MERENRISTQRVIDYIYDLDDGPVKEAANALIQDYELGQNSYIGIDLYTDHEEYKPLIDFILSENGGNKDDDVILLVWW